MNLQRNCRATAIFLVTAAIVIATLSMSVASPLQAQSFSGTLVPVAGLVQILHKGTSEWVNVVDKQLVQEGDQVRTGGDGLAELNIVTGIVVDIYPTSVVQMDSLSMRQDSGQVFNLRQLVGSTFTNVKQAVRQQDRISVTVPTAGITVHGTQFFTFVDPNLNVGVFSQDHPVEVETADAHKYTVTPDDFLVIKIVIGDDTIVCTVDFLKSNSKAQMVIAPFGNDQNKLQAMKEFLQSMLMSNLNPQVRAFLREFFGLPVVKLTGLSKDDDDKELKEIQSSIDALSADKVKLSDFLKKYRDFWGTTYKKALSDGIAPATCGNGKQDQGETAESCPSDFSDEGARGNGICETNRNGLSESTINNPQDCMPKGKLSVECSEVIEGNENPTATPTPKASGVGQ